MIKERLIGYDTEHNLSVFVVWIKSRFTWNYKSNKPKIFKSNKDAHYARYCCNRRFKRIGKLIDGIYVTTHSINNPCFYV